MFARKIIQFYMVMSLFFATGVIFTHDVLVEGKMAAFMPTGDTFKNVYGTSGQFGFEITAQIVDNIYGFTSFDFISKSGNTVLFHDATKLYTSNFGIGLKYFIPTDACDFYVGLGAQPTYLRTIDFGLEVGTEHDRWGWGGVAKIGAIINLPGSFFIDLFIDYSFVNINFTYPFDAPVQSADAVLNGAVFGLGFGYRFN